MSGLAGDARVVGAPRALGVDEGPALEGVDEGAAGAARWEAAGDLDGFVFALLAGDQVEDGAAEKDRVAQARREARLRALAQAPRDRRAGKRGLAAEPLRRDVGQPGP